MGAPEVNLKVLMGKEGYPAYRRLVGGTSYYRILHAKRFEELQLIGKRWLYLDVDAKAYPEQLRVREMMDMAGPFDELDAQEWERALRLAGKQH